MSVGHLKLKPHRGRGRSDAWWYEEAHGVAVIHEVCGEDGRYIRTDQLHIGWWALRNALTRLDRK